jgi:transcriptional regulator with XRE-family HTH domain
MGFYNQLGERVRKLREISGLTQNELARLLDVKRTAVVQMEKGQRKIYTEEAVGLSEIFRISISELVDPSRDVEVVLEESEKQAEPKPQIRINIPQNNWEKFREVFLYILDKVGAKPDIDETVIYKLLYFIDFDFYEKYEEQLIGAAYMKNKFGPTPVEFAKIVDKMLVDHSVMKLKTEYHGYVQTRYLPLREPDLSVLRAHEIKLIDEVLNRLSDMTAAKISEYSHGDVPWLTTEDGQIIEYESVFYRTPFYSVRGDDEEI